MQQITNYVHYSWETLYIDSLAQDCSNSIANALELLQSCTNPSIWCGYQACSINVHHSDDTS